VSPRKFCVALVASVAVSLALVSTASAATISPDTTADDFGSDLAHCSLREAIQSANTDADFGGCVATGSSYTSGGADTINLAASTTYNIQTLDFPDYGEDANVKGDFDVVAGAGLTIQSLGTGATRSTVEGNQVDRIFHILSTNPGPVTISGVILNDGRADQIPGEKGGAILNEGGNLTVTGSDITFNIAGAGGAGIETNGTSATQITDSSFISNNQCCDSPSSGGGAIDVSSGGGGSLTITNSEIGAGSGGANQAQGQSTTPGRGGGIYFAPATNATLSVTDSRIVSNAVNSNGGGSQGGGVFVGGATGSTVSFTRALIDNNSVGPITPTDPARGGGVYIDGPGATFTDSLIKTNQGFVTNPSANQGGGIYVNSSSSAVRLVGTTVASNTLSSGTRSGGGVFNNGTLVLLNSTVDGNNAGTGSGGGLTEAAGTASIFNSTFANNNAFSGASIRLIGGTATVRGSISDSNNDGCLGSIVTGGFNVGSDETCWPTSGTDIGSAAVDLLGPADNGTTVAAGGTTGGTAVPVQTDAPDLTSDAIDTIPAASCTNDSSAPLTVDQRSFPRPIDGNGDFTDACDSGAVEVAACDGTEATIVGTNGADATLDGTSGTDVIVGAGGNDTIDGMGGADTICGGSGNDQITGGAAVDDLLPGPGLNTVLSQDGLSDTINCTGGGPDSGTVDTSPAETYVSCDTDGDGVVDFLDACPTQSGTSNGCPASTPPPPPNTSTGPTGQRAAALKKCKKKKSAQARKKCKAKANKLPV
jgi:CSLREA domain-containing protein